MFDLKKININKECVKNKIFKEYYKSIDSIFFKYHIIKKTLRLCEKKSIK